MEAQSCPMLTTVSGHPVHPVGACRHPAGRQPHPLPSSLLLFYSQVRRPLEAPSLSGRTVEDRWVSQALGSGLGGVGAAPHKAWGCDGKFQVVLENTPEEVKPLVKDQTTRKGLGTGCPPLELRRAHLSLKAPKAWDGTKECSFFCLKGNVC